MFSKAFSRSSLTQREKIMKKIVSLALVGIWFVTSVPAYAGSPLGLNAALSFSLETTVATSSGNFQNSQVFPLANGKTLVTWAEETNSRSSLRAKVVSSSNKLGKVINITPSPAFVGASYGTRPMVSVNSRGKFFAAWVVQETKNAETIQKIVGRTSRDGISWSKLFPIVKSLKLTGGQDCMGEADTFPGCGFTSLKTALDDTGRYGVLYTTSVKDGVIGYRATATSKTKSWPTPKLLGNVPRISESEIVGLDAGFAVNYTNYNGLNCITSVSYFDPKYNGWIATKTAQDLQFNSYIFSHWVQRSPTILTLITASQENVGGIWVRNFNLKTKTWVGEGVTAQQPIPEIVIQSMMAIKSGKNLLIAYTIYDRTNRAYEAKLIMQNGISAGFTQGSLGSSTVEMTPLYLGVNQTKDPVFAYLADGTFLTVFSNGSMPAPISNSSGNQALQNLVVTNSNTAYGLGVSSGAKYKLIMVVGQLR